MWCRQCQQDVPAALGEHNRLACPRCALILRETPAAPLPSDAPADISRTAPPAGMAQADQAATAPHDGVELGPPPELQALGNKAATLPPVYDPWEVDQRLSHIGRVLHGAATADAATAAGEPRKRRRKPSTGSSKGSSKRMLRFDGAHTDDQPQRSAPDPVRIDARHRGVPAWHAGTAARQTGKAARRSKRRRGAAPAAAQANTAVWLALSLGVMMFVCGGILLGWSVAAGRKELWSLGLPIALVGQVGLLIGLVLQLERMWRHNHATVARLENVDEQLHDLKSTTALLGTTHSTPAVAFYSHMAGGASPQLLLTDLKGQLDLLAVKIGQMGD